MSEKKAGALAIFARAPELGSVKTRLARASGDEATLRFYRAMLRDVFGQAARFCDEFSGEMTASLWLASSEIPNRKSPRDNENGAAEVENAACENGKSEIAHTEKARFQTAEKFALGEKERREDETCEDGACDEETLRGSWKGAVFQQVEGDLGAKLSDCFWHLRQRSSERIVVIGSDAPDLPTAFLGLAFEKLSENDLVFGPASDGGFYLVGASCALESDFFDGVKWSSEQTLRDVLARAQSFDLSVAILPMWSDVDDEDDLRALHERLESGQSVAPHCHRVLDSLFR